MKNVASLRYGVIFKKAFSNVDIFRGFVRDILGVHLEIDSVETEKEFKPAIGHVAVKFDLYAKDEKNKVIVEIQQDRNIDHYDRFLHYHCVALLEQIKTSINYRPKLTVYTIVVLTSGDKHQCDVSVVDFDPKTLDGKPLHEIKHKIIYICPKYLNSATPTLYREWLQVIEDSLDNQIDESKYHLPEIKKVIENIEENSVSPEEKARMIEESYLEEALTKGIELGKIEIAKTMLAKNLAISMIMELTGLDEQTILTLE